LEKEKELNETLIHLQPKRYTRRELVSKVVKPAKSCSNRFIRVFFAFHLSISSSALPISLIVSMNEFTRNTIRFSSLCEMTALYGETVSE
jgi:hypothetical protein